MAARPVSALSRFVPIATLLAIAVHLIAVGLFLVEPPSEGGGGGGQVLGQLSVSLGGSGVAAPTESTDAKPVVETQSVPPTPRVERPQPRRIETPVQTPRVVHAKPALRQPVEAMSAAEPGEQTLDVSSATGDAGDDVPVGSTSAGALALGEGVASLSAGVGAIDAMPGEQRDAYLSLIRARVEKNRTYPSAARRRREEGMAVMQITIDGRGRLSQVQITTGAGSFHLDRAAKRMVEKSAPFPSPPVTPFTATIPIVFSLGD